MGEPWNITLGERSQSEKAIYCMIFVRLHLYKVRRKGKSIKTKTKLGVARSRGKESGGDW